MLYRNKLILFFANLFIVGNIFAQSPNLSWYSKVGSTGSDYAYTVSVDNSNNVYTAGFFSGTVDFNSDAGDNSLTSSGLSDSYIMKHDASGNFLWAIKIGGTSSDYIFTSDIDEFGNVYVAGYYKGTCDFDPTANNFSLTASGSFDVFVAKYSSSGSLIWAKTINGAGDELCNAICISGSKLFISGHFSQSVDFNPSQLNQNLTAQGTMDGFICEWDTSGTFNWVKHFTGNDAMVLRSINSDVNGNVLACGYFGGTYDFNPAQGIDTLSAVGQDDAFVLKLDANGNYLWARSFGSTATDYALSARFNSTSEVFVAGYFSSTCNFVFPNDTIQFTSAGMDDSYLCKLDENGNLIWIQQYGSTSYDEFKAMVIDSNSNVYLAGVFNGAVDFDHSNNVNTLTSGGGDDGFVLKLNSNGVYEWALNFSGTSNGYLFGIDLDENNDVLTAGYFSGTCDFDPGVGNNSATSLGSVDASVVKLTQSFSTSVKNEMREKIVILSGVDNSEIIIKCNGNYNAKILNLNGQLIKSIDVENDSRINLTEFNKGIYFLNLNDVNFKFVR